MQVVLFGLGHCSECRFADSPAVGVACIRVRGGSDENVLPWEWSRSACLCCCLWSGVGSRQCSTVECMIVSCGGRAGSAGGERRNVD